MSFLYYSARILYVCIQLEAAWWLACRCLAMCTVKAYNKDIYAHTYTHARSWGKWLNKYRSLCNTHQSCPGIKQWLDMRHMFITFLLEFIWQTMGWSSHFVSTECNHDNNDNLILRSDFAGWRSLLEGRKRSSEECSMQLEHLLTEACSRDVRQEQWMIHGTLSMMKNAKTNSNDDLSASSHTIACCDSNYCHQPPTSISARPVQLNAAAGSRALGRLQWLAAKSERKWESASLLYISLNTMPCETHLYVPQYKWLFITGDDEELVPT